MPAVQRSEFALALNQVATERGVDVAVVLDTVKNAILAAYRKDHPGIEAEEYTADLNPNTGEAHILHNSTDVTPPGFGRIAAQTAKQVILQKIREKEKEAILSDYRLRIGTVVNGMVLRFVGPNVIVDIGKTEALMPPQEQIGSEKYRLNQRMAVHLLEIREGQRGEEIIVSRASNGLLEGLFKREVPEVAQGSVQIKAIVREPGNRAKVAVASTQPGIDPVGSCVGQKGVRIQAIIQEFNGLEKIDIIQWIEDTKTYIANALSPAKNVRVELNEEEKVAHVFVTQDQLSLTIGGGGQNVRLASKLTGYRIEVEGEGGVVEEEKEPKEEAKAAESKEEKGTKETASTSNVANANAADAEGPKETKVKKKAKTAEGKEQKVEEADEAESEGQSAKEEASTKKTEEASVEEQGTEGAPVESVEAKEASTSSEDDSRQVPQATNSEDKNEEKANDQI